MPSPKPASSPASSAVPALPGWAWYCDGCGLPTRLRGEGRWLCPRCGHALWLRHPQGCTPTLVGGSVVPMEDAVALDVPCAKHPTLPATGACERCGDFRCGPCTRMFQGRSYCQPCFEPIKHQPRWRALADRYSPHLVMAVLVLAGVALQWMVLVLR